MIGYPYLVLMLDKPEDRKRPGCNNLFYHPKPKEVEADAEKSVPEQRGSEAMLRRSTRRVPTAEEKTAAAQKKPLNLGWLDISSVWQAKYKV